MFKILGGTASGGENLCRTCRKAKIYRGQASTSEVVECHFSSPVRMKEAVSSCSAYLDLRRAPLYQMEQIAWEVKTDRSGKTVGFKSPREKGESSPLGFIGGEE